MMLARLNPLTPKAKGRGDEPTNQRTDDTKQDRDDKPPGVIARHNQLSENTSDETENDPSLDAQLCPPIVDWPLTTSRASGPRPMDWPKIESGFLPNTTVSESEYRRLA
jgi:hypothetical protein